MRINHTVYIYKYIFFMKNMKVIICHILDPMARDSLRVRVHTPARDPSLDALTWQIV